MKILNETTVFQPKTVQVLVETQEECDALVRFVTDEYDWISNIGNTTYDCPKDCGVGNYTKIEIQRRNGEMIKGCVADWSVSWKEVDNDSYDIVRFRIVK
jgi:hypothetical protein